MSKKHIHFPRTTPAQRKLLFETWEATGNVPAACQVAHVGRGTFYYWKPRFDAAGYAALLQFADHAPKAPARISDRLAQRVIALRQQHPTWGKRRISDELAKANHWVPLLSPNRVKRILMDAGLWNRLAHRAKKKTVRSSVVRRMNPAKRST